MFWNIGMMEWKEEDSGQKEFSQKEGKAPLPSYGTSLQELGKWSGALFDRLIRVPAAKRGLWLLLIPLLGGVCLFVAEIPALQGNRYVVPFLWEIFVFLSVNLLIHVGLTWVERWNVLKRKRFAGGFLVASFVAVLLFSLLYALLWQG